MAQTLCWFAAGRNFSTLPLVTFKQEKALDLLIGLVHNVFKFVAIIKKKR
jgi:hypothetical protein